MSNKLPNSLRHTLESNPRFNRETFAFRSSSEANYDAIRFHPLKPLDRERYPIGDPVPWCENSYYLTQKVGYTGDPLYHAGTYSLENAHSLFIDHILRELQCKDEYVKVLDLSAETGNRSTLISDNLGLSSLIVANQRNETASLRQHLRSWGKSNIIATNNDASAFRGLPAYFDIMVFAAPSSEFQRVDMEVKDEDWSQANIRLHQDRQQSMLTSALSALKKGGYLIYSTQSSTGEENEEIVQWLKDTYEMESVAIPFDTSWGILMSCADAPDSHAYRLLSDTGSTFFAVLRMTRNELFFSTDEVQQEATASVVDTVAGQWLEMGGLMTLAEEQKLYAYPLEFRKDISMLSKVLTISSYGSYLGRYEEDGRFVPDRTLAFNTSLRSEIETFDLDEREASHFAKGKLPQRVTQYRGHSEWYVLRYSGVNIGLVQL